MGSSPHRAPNQPPINQATPNNAFTREALARCQPTTTTTTTTEQQKRYAVLELALKSPGLQTPSDVVDAARHFYDYVEGEKE